MTRLAPLLLLLCLVACDGGVGRPIVGHTPPPDAAVPMACAVQPACVPIRDVPEDHFAILDAMPRFHPPADCDADEVEDELDNCPGVFNPTQSPDDCASANDDCERLAAGEMSLAEADLRGCRIERPIPLSADMDLGGAQLACSELRFLAEAPRRLGLSQAELTSVHITVDGPVDVSMNRTTLDRSALSLERGARVQLHDSILRNTGLWLDPEAAIERADPAGPGIDIARADLDNVTIREPASSRAARLRIDGSNLGGTAIAVPSLDLHASTVVSSRLWADDVSVQEAVVNTSQLRGDFVSIASAELSDVIFDRCVDLRVSDTTLTDVDVPACEPSRFRALRTDIEASRIEGGLELDDGSLLASVVVGAGPESAFVSRESVVNGVKFCDPLGGGAFLGGEIRCAGCDPRAFMDGVAVCVSGTSLFERGCPQIELAPSCE